MIMSKCSAIVVFFWNSNFPEKLESRRRQSDDILIVGPTRKGFVGLHLATKLKKPATLFCILLFKNLLVNGRMFQEWL